MYTHRSPIDHDNQNLTASPRTMPTAPPPPSGYGFEPQVVMPGGGQPFCQHESYPLSLPSTGTVQGRSAGLAVEYRGTNASGKGGCDTTTWESTLKRAVPREQRVWTKRFIKQWQHDVFAHSHTAGSTAWPTHSSSSSDGESDAASAKAASTDQICIPADYQRWLTTFLHKKYSKMGVTLITSDHKVDVDAIGQFQMNVPTEYREWVRCYFNRRCKRSRENKHFEGRTQLDLEEEHRKWLLAFKRMRLKAQQEKVSAETSFSLLHRRDVHPWETSAALPENKQALYMEVLQDSTDTSDSDSGKDNGKPLQKQKKIPHEFRIWAKDALNQWDGKTLHASEYLELSLHEGTQQHYGSNQDIPPNILKWMVKVMDNAEKRRMKAQLKTEKQEMKAQRKEAKAERKAVKEGLKITRKSLKVAKQAMKLC